MRTHTLYLHPILYHTLTTGDTNQISIYHVTLPIVFSDPPRFDEILQTVLLVLQLTAYIFCLYFSHLLLKTANDVFSSSSGVHVITINVLSIVASRLIELRELLRSR